MPPRLVPCSSCFRHVRAFDTTCPFCGSAVVVPALKEPNVMPAASITRAAIFFAGATAVSACSSSTAPPPVGVLYGPVQIDAGETKDSGSARDSGRTGLPDGATGILYGPVQVDSGHTERDAGRTGFPDGEIGVLYGPAPH